MKSARPGKVRIIAGEWRGRLLAVADQVELRPTPNRVRETLFNWLASSMSGANCLDLFAGTGALAFEAVSRGAASAMVIERDPKLVAVLQNNKTILNANSVEVVHCDATEWLAHCTQRFDVIFLDPPFHQGLILRALEVIQQRLLLTTNGVVYIESESGLSLPDYLITHKQKTSGQVQYGLYCLT